jgi:drug/metabolite transporter (DMT)-like permease
VLAEMPLSAAFPLSAVSYVLIIAASALVFHEPVGLLQVVGSLAILVGVWLIGRGGPETPPGPVA